MSNKRPWYRWFPGDFASSPRVRLLTLEQEACVRRLLDIQWQSPDCTIPDNLDMLCAWTTNVLRDEYERITVLQFFPIVSEGKRANERLYQEYLDTLSRSEKAKQSIEKRWNKGKSAKNEVDTNVLRTNYERNTNVIPPYYYSHSHSHSDQIIPPIVPQTGDGQSYNERNTNVSPKKPRKPKEIDLSQDAGFMAFWRAYPKKVGRGAAEAIWSRLKPSEGLSSAILEAVVRQSKSVDWLKDGGQYVPMPSTWLNQRRWLDEGVTRQGSFAGDTTDDLGF